MKKFTHWKNRDVMKMNRVIDIQDTDTGYELIKKYYKRSMTITDNGELLYDSNKIKQPKID